MSVTPRDKAVFEAGIKLGALYHQFVGSPISPKTVDSLEKAISQSISVQPFVKSITVHIDRDMVMENLNSFGYTELTGPMLTVDAVIRYENYEVFAGMALKDGYPLMQVKEVKEA
ncbi:MAG TPA: dihydroneopterin aldolase family protein [Methanocella sp.]|uniref:dihydroneopterin aldolase family protein n=1 Tax=Methanocella sp. TaxID=2052833 RepID=UPI002BF6E646|nr:dihydroneopterin aldolase family protein [Methanocella sp.]HTY90940.1 dihydroneopterin aldolase family protein [Methanocella sp.]